MTIEEVQKERIKLEEKFCKLIDAFEKKTHTKVNTIRVHYPKFSNEQGFINDCFSITVII